MPFLKNLVKEDHVFTEYLKNIYATILYKDIISRFQIRNTQFLENLVQFLSNNIGNVISANKISDYLKSQKLKISPQLVINYLNYLSQAFLIFQVKRNDILGKKIFEIHEKYYFEDWGIVNAMLGFQNMDIGKIIENAVFMHLKIQGYKIHIGVIGDKEIDFVVEKNGTKLYLQVCYLLSDEKVKQREFGNLMLIGDNYPKYVISLDEFAPADLNGIKHIHLRELLSGECLV
jgi:predicted AAA+ superfamily ATPase